MATIPGSVGLPVLGDKSYEFYKDPVKFCQKNMNSHKCRLFYNRFLNKPTAFICSNNAVHELLTVHNESLELGYKAFMGEIFGDNILFSDGEDARKLRSSLKQLFTLESIDTYQLTIDSVVDKAVATINPKEPTCVYSLMKKICTEICLSVFLGLNFTDACQTANTIVALTTTHWHGIISVPLPLKLPMTSGSTYSQALNAKDSLLKIIISKREESSGQFAQKVEDAASTSEDGLREVFINNHLLLFTSALVPKALSSLLTSLIMEVGKEKGDLQEKLLSDPEMMEAVLLEVQRLYPPFLGGRRIVKKDIVLGGYKIPAGHSILYVTQAAHRDPDAFADPDTFNPHRWINCSPAQKEKLFCFGAGPRNCIGRHLVWKILQTIIVRLLCSWKFELLGNQDFSHKWLPVSKPKQDVKVQFSSRNAA
ncbi:putative cytochrome P450 120 [Ylistrum balloti]|uniref:putative cytochrome P450 120 n=1 Tax=Ylistrum balloti TaxID=509963 RepID=UPI002905DA36|nr:putative cytochrome P450 120 [Ylistrum balloti]